MKSQNENSATDQTKQKNKRYVFAQRQEDDFTCLKLTEGKYKDIIYKYDKVKFAPEANEKGEIPLKFTYDIYLNPNKIDVEDIEFRNYIGDILIELVEQQLKDGAMIIDE